MTLYEFLKDHVISLLIVLALSLFISPLLFSFNRDLAFLFLFLYYLAVVSVFFYEYFRRKRYYTKLLFALKKLDQKYLILEVLEHPHFLDGKILEEVLYEVDKSMSEEVNRAKKRMLEFKEYVELWIHEVKIPLASAFLKIHNHPEAKRLTEEITRLENSVEQVLYYVRSENTEKDYLIKSCSLEDVVSVVVRKNKDSLLLKHIRVELKDLDKEVLTDAKWLEFMIGQIISNSIKYSKEKDAHIIFEAHETKKSITLVITDNGIGIPENDIPRVFEKSFTGENGRIGQSSTGMGLYLCKKLSDKLGHQIQLTSTLGKLTQVSLTFSKEDYYDILHD